MTFPTPTRYSDAIMDDFDAACAGRADIDPREILHEVIADIMDTVRITLLRSPMASAELTLEVLNTAEDYVVNFYGDD